MKQIYIVTINSTAVINTNRYNKLLHSREFPEGGGGNIFVYFVHGHETFYPQKGCVFIRVGRNMAYQFYHELPKLLPPKNFPLNICDVIKLSKTRDNDIVRFNILKLLVLVENK